MPKRAPAMPGDDAQADDAIAVDKVDDQPAAPDADTLGALHMRITELEATVALLEDQLAAAKDRAAAPAPAVPVAPRLIGEDWSNRTSAEARAAGVTQTVMCSDGYYVPAG